MLTDGMLSQETRIERQWEGKPRRGAPSSTTRPSPPRPRPATTAQRFPPPPWRPQETYFTVGERTRQVPPDQQ